MTDTHPPIRTRIAPSPTGFLHLGTARTALYSWAFARHHGGQFVLRIEDTDVARSTQASVDQILAAMHWLGLGYDEGPIHQMQRLDRYREVVDRLIAEGKAYRCWCTPEDLEAMKSAQEARGEKRRYDGTWRPAPGKALPPPPAGVDPVIRFANPADGEVSWDDLVKGPITIANREIDDLVIVRDDGVPTYNFAVVVDDWDMRISHVFRGDEHINNTPWQINIFAALGAPLPRFGHLPVILGDDGQKLSKRRGAVSVTAFEDEGYLPEGLNNYLARLGWSHGNDELFTTAQMVGWFDGSHLSKSPAQWDPAKLLSVNAHHMKQADDARLARLVAAQLRARHGVEAAPDAAMAARCALFKERCATTVELAGWLAMFFQDVQPSAEDLAQHLTEPAKAALHALRVRLEALADWDRTAIAAAMKETLAEHGLKMPQLAIPLRVVACGRVQTPAIDAVLALFERATLVQRLREF
jgi:glutamyl-tRNA synthetase